MKTLKNNQFERMKKGAVATLCVLFFTVLGCGEKSLVKNSDENDGNPFEVNCEEMTSLKGSVWKLAGYVNAQGVLKEIGPKDCENCHTLWFDTDYTVTVISIQQRFKLDLSNLNPFAVEIDKMLRCWIYDKDGKEYCDLEGFENSIVTTGSWSATCDELKLFQHYLKADGEVYIPGAHLLFKRIDRDPPTTLRGTKWKLEGIVDTQTGELIELEPKNCDECYTLSFWGDFVISSKSINFNQALSLLNLDLERDPIIWQGFEDDPDYPLTPFYEETWYDDIHFGGDGKTYEDSWLFRCGIAYTKSHEFTSDGKLKLFFVYQGKKYYLLFKLVYS